MAEGNGEISIEEVPSKDSDVGRAPDYRKLVEYGSDTKGMEEAIGAVPAYAELDAAVEIIHQTLNILEMGEFPHTDKTYSELKTELNSAAVVLRNASSQVVDSVDTDKLPASAADFQASFERLVAVCLEMAGHAEETDSRTQMVSSLKTVSVNSSKLLSTAKSVSQDLKRPDAKNQLAAAARAVTESINDLDQKEQKEFAILIDMIRRIRSIKNKIQKMGPPRPHMRPDRRAKLFRRLRELERDMPKQARMMAQMVMAPELLRGGAAEREAGAAERDVTGGAAEREAGRG